VAESTMRAGPALELDRRTATALQKEIDAPDRSLAAADRDSQLKSAKALLATLYRML
jgi:hypothetical protein